jgi:hypothetical protein
MARPLGVFYGAPGFHTSIQMAMTKKKKSKGRSLVFF